MKGTMITIHPDGVATFVPLNREPRTDEIRDALGGWLEAVPFFDLFPFDNDTLQACVVYCDEEGKMKDLPVNPVATKIWHGILDIRRASEPANFPWDIAALKQDVLCGNIVILTGDEEFMRSMRDDVDEEEEA